MEQEIRHDIIKIRLLSSGVAYIQSAAAVLLFAAQSVTVRSVSGFSDSHGNV